MRRRNILCPEQRRWPLDTSSVSIWLRSGQRSGLQELWVVCQTWDQGPKSKATRKNLGIIRKKHARDEWKDSLWLQQQYFSNLVVKLLCPVRFSVAVMPWTQSLAPLRHEISLIVGFARCSCNIHPWTLDSEMLHSGILRDCTCLFRHGTVMEMLRHLTKCKVSKGFFFFRTSSPFLHSI